MQVASTADKMALEALSSNELLNFIIYDTISATSFSKHEHVLETGFAFENYLRPPQQHDASTKSSCLSMSRCENLVVQRKKKRKRKPRACKNKEEAETQRMTHIAVERNRRRQMNDHLGVLRSLMPKSYVQRGDQASIVGSAIEFVKELEQLLQSLEAQKLQLLQGITSPNDDTTTSSAAAATTSKFMLSPFSQLFAHPQFSWSQLPNKYTLTTKAATADVEATLIEKHANLRILTRRRLRQLSKLVTGFQTVQLTILHLNVTTMDPLVLYSISAKVEEGCQLTSVDDIAGAVQHMLRIIEEEVVLC